MRKKKEEDISLDKKPGRYLQITAKTKARGMISKHSQYKLKLMWCMNEISTEVWEAIKQIWESEEF